MSKISHPTHYSIPNPRELTRCSQGSSPGAPTQPIVLFPTKGSSHYCSMKKLPALLLPRTKTQLPLLLQMGNELNSDLKLAAQIVLGLVLLIITLLLALPRFQQVELVLELISEAVGILVSIVVLLQQLIRDLHQIISMAHDGFQQVVSVLELIVDVVGSLVKFGVLLLRLIHLCRRIWSIWTARQPIVVANGHQNEVPFVDVNYGQNDIPVTDAEADAANSQNDVIVNEELNI